MLVLLAPIAPFITDHIWRDLYGGRSVHVQPPPWRTEIPELGPLDEEAPPVIVPVTKGPPVPMPVPRIPVPMPLAVMPPFTPSPAPVEQAVHSIPVPMPLAVMPPFTPPPAPVEQAVHSIPVPMPLAVMPPFTPPPAPVEQAVHSIPVPMPLAVMPPFTPPPAPVEQAVHSIPVPMPLAVMPPFTPPPAPVEQAVHSIPVPMPLAVMSLFTPPPAPVEQAVPLQSATGRYWVFKLPSVWDKDLHLDAFIEELEQDRWFGQSERDVQGGRVPREGDSVIIRENRELANEETDGHMHVIGAGVIDRTRDRVPKDWETNTDRAAVHWFSVGRFSKLQNGKTVTQDDLPLAPRILEPITEKEYRQLLS